MKITCITTAFNEGALLLNSVNSILNQIYADFQYIIVDDGADKDTRDIIQAIDNPRVLVIRQANDGLSSARNKALEQMTGDYVCFLDADDTRPTWAFQAIADVILRDDPDLIFCKGAVSDVRGHLQPFYDSGKFDAIRTLIGDAPASPDTTEGLQAIHLAQLLEPQSANKVVRSAMLRAHHLCFPNTHFFEDTFFHTGVLAHAQKISFLHSPCFTYFQRYLRPQITATSGEIRFDIIPVTKLTLEVFATCPQFHDPIHRAAVVAACFKWLHWCEKSISHHHRPHFRDASRALIALMNPLYLAFPTPLPPDMPEVAAAQSYIDLLRFTDPQPLSDFVKEDHSYEKTPDSRIYRIWKSLASGRRAG